MLGMRTYPQEYIDACRDRVDAQVAEFRALSNVPEAFATAYFADLVIVIDAMFTHRLRTVEGKNGTPLNEVRVLAESLMQGDVLVADPSIRWRADEMVLGLAAGDVIALTEKDFTRLCEAYFAEIESTFGE